MSLEEAVRRWTWVPANTFGMQGRGSLQEGMHADVVVFDPDKIDIGNKEIIGDVPSGETRYIQKAEGIEYTIVNGRVLMDHDKPSGDLNGKVLRSSASNGKR
jgi:N-acyl-D-aspartate/D-glutamate deacylase